MYENEYRVYEIVTITNKISNKIAKIHFCEGEMCVAVSFDIIDKTNNFCTKTSDAICRKNLGILSKNNELIIYFRTFKYVVNLYKHLIIKYNEVNKTHLILQRII